VDRPLADHVLHEELDRPPADPVIGLKLSDELQALPAFDAREHAWRERTEGILTDTQLELCMGSAFADSRRFDDVRVDEKRRYWVTFTKRPEALQVLDGRNTESPAKCDVDLRRLWFAQARVLRSL
jgi:hypothetical protein